MLCPCAFPQRCIAFIVALEGDAIFGCHCFVQYCDGWQGSLQALPTPTPCILWCGFSVLLGKETLIQGRYLGLAVLHIFRCRRKGVAGEGQKAAILVHFNGTPPPIWAGEGFH